MKKFTALMLVILAIITSIPMSAKAASNDIFFATDVHGKTSNLTNILKAVKKNTDIGIVALGGDYEVSVSSLQSSIKSVFPNAKMYFTTGNHDKSGNDYQKTGQVTVNEHFSLYMIRDDEFKNSSTVTNLSNYLKGYNSNNQTAGKPLFIVAHKPLHADRGDNTNAHNYANLLNEYGKKMDIVYVWGHNHTVDKNLWYKTIGDELTPQGGSKIKLTFTYMTAGYVKEGYGMTARVNNDSIVIQRYNTSGKHEAQKTIKRIAQAYNCTTNGHQYSNKTFMPTIKAYTFSCQKCNNTFHERLAGDCDGDGLIKANDARYALRCSVGLEEPDLTTFAAADADKNSVVNAADARLILRKSVELPDEDALWEPIPVDKNGNKIA